MYREIKIDQIKSNPSNPRIIFEGKKFDDLVNSIKEKGVLEPILVRPMGTKFEIVVGERRYRAMLQISGEQKPGPGGSFEQTGIIPAIIKPLSDDEAFEIMIIENLQREDLTPFEEARSFEKYAEKHGKDGIQSLGQRTGIRPAYIRRRIAVLRLPKRALDAWDKESLTFGHLEELIRLKDPQDLKEAIGKLLDHWRHMTVKDLRDYINSMIPLLAKAKFDKTECSNCMQNSDVQKKLWDIEAMKKTHCLNPKCFKKKQVDYLTKNWQETPWAKRFKTTGFVFNQDIQWEDHNEFYLAPFKKCLEGCKKFKTIIDLDGSLEEGQSCVKGKECFQSLMRSRTQKETMKEKDKKDDGGPRVHWHGQHFREEFFKERIPEQFKTLPPTDVRTLRATLYALVKMKWGLKTIFLDMTDVKHEDHWAEEKDLFGAIAKMERGKLLQIIKELSIQVILGTDVGAEGRWLMANHIGINLAKEWSPPDDFYQMKTIRELLEYGDKSGILQEKKAQTFLKDILKKKKLSACKKSELVRVFKESGVNLIGKVPNEILKKEND